MVVDASTARGSHTSLKPRGATNLRGWRCAAVIGGRCARGRHWCPVRRRVAQRPRHLLWPAAVTEKKPKPCEATAVNAAATVVAGFIASFLGCRLAASPPLVAPCFSTAVLEARKQSVVASLTLATTMYYYGTSMLRSIPSIHDDVQRLLLCRYFFSF